MTMWIRSFLQKDVSRNGDIEDRGIWQTITEYQHRALVDCRMNQRVFELLGKEIE